MRLVIDKDVSEIRLLKEAYERKMPTYSVRAINARDSFTYARKLKFNEAVDTTYDLIFDPQFSDCRYEIVESVAGRSHVIWDSGSSSRQNGVVSEAAKNGGNKDKGNNKGKDKGAGVDGPSWWQKLGQKAAGVLKGLGNAINIVGSLTKNFSKDMLAKWRDAHYFNKQGYITGLGYKVMTGQTKNTVPADTGDKKNDIKNVWEAAKSNVIQGLKKNGMNVNGDITAIVKNDKDPVLLSANVKTKDGEQTLTLDQDGNAVDGNGDAVDPNAAGGNNGGGNGGGNNGGGNGGGNNGGGNGGGNNGGNGGGANTQQITPDQAQKNPKAALGNLATRVANLEKEVGIASESIESGFQWRFNGAVCYAGKAIFEHDVIKSFFSALNDESVEKIVLKNGKDEFTYDPKEGSSAYKSFKYDFKKITDQASRDKSAVGFSCVENKKSTDKMSGIQSKKSFNMSDFDRSADFEDGFKRVVVFDCVVEKFNPGHLGKKEDDGAGKSELKKGGDDKADDDRPASAVNESLSIEMPTGMDVKSQLDALTRAMAKYGTQVAEKPNPVIEPGNDVVNEADGDDDAGGGDDGGGDADPFGGGGDDGGGDAGGDADPFGGGDDAGDGDDAGGGDDADPFGGGGDDAGADAGGDDAGADAGGDDAGADAGAEGDDSAEGEPAPDAAINTDAQGEPKSQYNINVTKPFNANDDFKLNEEEQKEFFGKIDQLVKIPDMENYSLYLYQITPENLNLDDVHYITSLYELSVKLGLLEDVYADSNLLDKYSNYKYSVMKDGDDSAGTSDGLQIQEGRRLFESSKVQTSNDEKAQWMRDNKDDRRGPKDDKLNKDKNGADKPEIIDTTKPDWDKKDGKKAIDSTMEGDFMGLGWVVTFKAMQFGSPRYMSMYIKKNGKEKAETQCEKYLKKLSYTDIEFVHIEEVDPYEMISHNCTTVKRVEDIQNDKYINEKFNESSDDMPSDVKKDIRRVVSALNKEIRTTKQFNFLMECGVEKPQFDADTIMECFTKPQVNEDASETIYKFILRKNDSMESRMFYSNLKEKLFRYLGTFATRFGLEFGGQVTPTLVELNFMRLPVEEPPVDGNVL